MNNTIRHLANGDFEVLPMTAPRVDYTSKFFVYNFETDEYLSDGDCIPIPFDSRSDAFKYTFGDEIIKTYAQLPIHIKNRLI